MPSGRQSSRVTMPPSNFGARRRRRWRGTRAVADRLRRRRRASAGARCPVLYGVPRTMKLRGRVAPGLAQPVEVRLEAAGATHDGAADRASRRRSARRGGTGRRRDRARRPRRRDVDAQTLGGGVVAVHQRLAAAEEERVGARQVQRAAQRRWKRTPNCRIHPGTPSAARSNEPRQRSSVVARVDAQQVREKNSSSIRAGEHVRSAPRARSAGCACGGCCRRASGAARARGRRRAAPASRAVGAAHRPALPPPMTDDVVVGAAFTRSRPPALATARRRERATRDQHASEQRREIGRVTNTERSPFADRDARGGTAAPPSARASDRAPPAPAARHARASRSRPRRRHTAAPRSSIERFRL